jgi:uncharacterized protein (TIGR02246 family)
MQNQQPERNRIVKIFMLLFFVIWIFTSCEMKHKAPAQENIEQTILTLERQALDRWSKGDPLGFAEILAEDGTYFDDIGAHKRLNNLEEIKNYLTSLVGKIPPHTYEIVDPKFQVYGDIAILTYQYHTTMPDNEPGSPWKATEVYHFADGKWRLVHANWSLVKEQ